VKESIYFLLFLASAITTYFMLTALAKFAWKWFWEIRKKGALKW